MGNFFGGERQRVAVRFSAAVWLAVGILTVLSPACTGRVIIEKLKVSGEGEKEQFFLSSVATKMRAANCQSCHESSATPLIFEYGYSLSLLQDGPSAVDNAFINKPLGAVTHGGGRKCLDDFEEPCASLQTWWNLENPTDEPPDGGPPDPVGVLSSIDQNGNITGYAFDRNNSGTTLEIELWMDGPAGSGTFLTRMQANGARPFPPLNSGYAYTTAAMYQDATLRRVYGYMVHPTSGELLPLGNSPKEHMAGFVVAKRDYFTNTVLPKIQNRCAACHGSDFDDYFRVRNFYLMAPSRFLGGTATNNLIVQKGSGGASHGGGNICGGVAGSPCAELQVMWNNEFGP